MTSDFDDALSVPGQDPEALDEALRRSEKPRQIAPQGWEPGIAWDGSEGILTTGPLQEAPDLALWSELIADWNLDPETTEIVPGSVQVRGWDANVGAGEIKRLRYYRATIRARSSAPSEERADVEELCRFVMSRKPRKIVEEQQSEISLVVPLADWQIGKGEGGGTEATVERICRGLDAMSDKVKEMKRKGRAPEAIYLLGMGDTVENCSGFYPMMEFQIDLDLREQKRVARRLWLRAIDAASGLAPRVVIAGIPGNHGENRRDGKAFTSWSDSHDLAVIEECAEICQHNAERYGHVSAVLARDLTLVLGVSGVNVGIAHGHQFGRGAGHSAGKAEKWWTGQIMGRQPMSEADILITGHLHHLIVAESTGRTHIQCPAQDGGSYWWTAQTGQHAPSGQLMLGVGKGYGARGWGDLEIVG
jgi:hypothetical protein